MNVVTNQGDSVKVIFVYQEKEQVEEVTLNTAQLTALLNSQQVWIERFSNNLRIKNAVWSYVDNNISMQIYLK